MGLEATVVCIDNSEWMRNGDYTPTRRDAQHDSVNLLCGAKMEQNPESEVAVLKMAGGARALVTLTDDLGKVLNAMSRVQLEGSCDLLNSLLVAALCLKHRRNKNQKQRIVAFVGSPLKGNSRQDLVKVGKRLKKNNVAVDIVSFGEVDENKEKLEALVHAANRSDNCHLVTVPPSTHILADVLISSPIVQGEGAVTSTLTEPAGGGGGGGGGGAFAEYGGIDPNIDPELAMAIRMSLEEAKAAESRDAAAGGEQQQQPAGAASATTTTTSDAAEAAAAPMQVDGGGGDDDELAAAIALSLQAEGNADDDGPPPLEDVPSDDDDDEEEEAEEAGAQDVEMTDAAEVYDEDAELALALEMSRATSSNNDSPPAQAAAAPTAAAATPTTSSATPTTTSAPAPAPAAAADEYDEDAELALAIQMSMAAGGGDNAQAASATSAEARGEASASAAAARDADFLQSVLGTLPGVDTSDESVQRALADATKGNEKKEEDGKKK